MLHKIETLPKSISNQKKNESAEEFLSRLDEELNLNFYKSIEEAFDCSGICSQAKYYYTYNHLFQGTPSKTCTAALIDEYGRVFRRLMSLFEKVGLCQGLIFVTTLFLFKIDRKQSLFETWQMYKKRRIEARLSRY